MLLLVLLFALATSKNVELDTDNFWKDTSSGTWFVKFYTHWCGYCKKLAPIWDEITEESEYAKFNFGQIDCDAHPRLCSKLGVQGYPTLKFFKDGKMYDYAWGNDKVALSEFMLQEKWKHQTGTPVDNLINPLKIFVAQLNNILLEAPLGGLVTFLFGLVVTSSILSFRKPSLVYVDKNE